MTPKFRFAAIAFCALLAGARSASAVVGPTIDPPAFGDRVVMILTRGPEGSGFCTGVVLSPRIVLTAAHCLRPPGDMLVHFRGRDGAPVFLKVEATSRHPGYVADAAVRRTRSIDIGLVETGERLPGSFRAAALSADAPGPGDAAIVVGFGVAAERRPATGGTLRAAELVVREPRSSVLLWLAAATVPGGACAGDSGGPILSADAESVVAITAWTEGDNGRKCGKLTQGVLVAPIRGWIATASRDLQAGAPLPDGE